MLTRTKSVLAALAVAGFAQAASAAEPLNARTGNQSPFASAGPSAQSVIVRTLWPRDGVNPNEY